MSIVGLVAAVAGVIAGRVTLVLAQEQLDPVRDNLSLPQVGLSVLSSLSAVVGALLKGELRAESSHKDVLLPLHALMNREFNLFTHEFMEFTTASEASNFFCNAGSPHAGVALAVPSVYLLSQDTRSGITSEDSSVEAHRGLIWRLALWLETKGYTSLKDWCNEDFAFSVFKRSHACMVVEDTPARPLRAFLHKMRLAWFKFNCDHVIRMVVASHPQDCESCLEIPGLAWPGVLTFLPRESWEDIQLTDHMVRFKCVGHGGRSPIAQALMDGIMGYKDRQRLAIMLVRRGFFDKQCLPKAYCTLDAVERNMLTEMAKVLVTEMGQIQGQWIGVAEGGLWHCLWSLLSP